MISDHGLDLALDAGLDPLAVAHSERFRKMGNGYPRLVAGAYSGDLRRAMADTDEAVAATVAARQQLVDAVKTTYADMTEDEYHDFIEGDD